MRLKTTLTFEYDANPEAYGTNIPELAAKIDQNAFDEDPTTLVYLLENFDSTVKVEPAPETEAIA